VSTSRFREPGRAASRRRRRPQEPLAMTAGYRGSSDARNGCTPRVTKEGGTSGRTNGPRPRAQSSLRWCNSRGGRGCPVRSLGRCDRHPGRAVSSVRADSADHGKVRGGSWRMERGARHRFREGRSSTRESNLETWFHRRRSVLDRGLDSGVIWSRLNTRSSPRVTSFTSR